MLGAYDFFCSSVLALTVLVGIASPHGYLIDPPQRSSLWREGFNTTKNYDDNALNCGGQWIQHESNKGKCGLCGDAYNGTRHHEIGGKFYTGIIARAYKMGSDIPVTVHLTTYHKGYFEFRLCAEVGLLSKESQDCLDRNVLLVRSNGEDANYQFFPTYTNRHYLLSVSLPQGVICDRCLFQWTYVTGKDSGDGPQEWFVNCADISIYDKQPPTSTPTTEVTTTSSTTTTTTTTTAETTAVPDPTHWDECVPTAPYSAIPGMGDWCRTLCPFFCPFSHCYCP